MNISKIKDAIRKVSAAKADLGKVVAEAFPVGADVSWDKRGHRQYGTVLGHGRTGDLRVENMATRKTYWVTMYDVVGYVD